MSVTQSKDAIIQAIRNVLIGPMAHPHMAEFGAQARLNEDLHLDSVMVLNLMLHLETAHGIDVPEREFSKDDFSTVADLAGLLLGETAVADPPEEEIDIKVHCFVSCLCAGIKQCTGLDHRPFYFGVWDTGFAVDEQARLSYHAKDITHDHFRHWFRRLYGVPVMSWYKPEVSKSENIARFEHLLRTKSKTEHLMVMLNMYHLPERENKFNQNPFPHYVIIEETDDPDMWFMHDPDYRWEGVLPRKAILNAIDQPSVAGGYIYDRARAQTPTSETLQAYFKDTFIGQNNPFTDTIDAIVRCHFGPSATQPISNLDFALREMPVIAIRKYAYEHGFAFFWRALGYDDDIFEDWCDVIEELCAGYRGLHYKVVKLSRLATDEIAQDVFAELQRLNALEFRIKLGLKEQFDRWCMSWQSSETSTPRLEELA